MVGRPVEAVVEVERDLVGFVKASGGDAESPTGSNDRTRYWNAVDRSRVKNGWFQGSPC